VWEQYASFSTPPQPFTMAARDSILLNAFTRTIDQSIQMAIEVPLEPSIVRQQGHIGCLDTPPSRQAISATSLLFPIREKISLEAENKTNFSHQRLIPCGCSKGIYIYSSGGIYRTIDQVSKVGLDPNKTDKLNEHASSIQTGTKVTSLPIPILRR